MECSSIGPLVSVSFFVSLEGAVSRPSAIQRSIFDPQRFQCECVVVVREWMMDLYWCCCGCHFYYWSHSRWLGRRLDGKNKIGPSQSGTKMTTMPVVLFWVVLFRRLPPPRPHAPFRLHLKLVVVDDDKPCFEVANNKRTFWQHRVSKMKADETRSTQGRYIVTTATFDSYMYY